MPLRSHFPMVPHYPITYFHQYSLEVSHMFFSIFSN
jgi:hypothetical protein